MSFESKCWMDNDIHPPPLFNFLKWIEKSEGVFFMTYSTGVLTLWSLYLPWHTTVRLYPNQSWPKVINKRTKNFLVFSISFEMGEGWRGVSIRLGTLKKTNINYRVTAPNKYYTIICYKQKKNKTNVTASILRFKKDLKLYLV